MNKLTIVGLGPGSLDSLSLKGYKTLKEAKSLYLRTQQHPLVQDLIKEGISFLSFDDVYNNADNFNTVYESISQMILEKLQDVHVVYAVPGHPCVAETTVENLVKHCDKQQIPYEIIGAESFIDALLVALKLDPIKGLNIIDGLQLDIQRPSKQMGNIITQVYNQTVASDVKLALMETYPDEYLITVIRGAGIPGEEIIQEIPLYQLDHLEWIDYLTSVYIPAMEGAYIQCNFPLDPLVNVLAELRGEGGCPWDREQTHQTLKKYLLEETYEVIETIDDGIMYKLCEELGDLLLQIVFHAQIARENQDFDMNDIIQEITEKMIRRHPHVFGNAHANTSGEVEVNWEAIKGQEKDAKGEREISILDGIPKSMPALLYADKLQKKAAKVGFDWPDYVGALSKVDEELKEVKDIIQTGSQDQLAGELGDLLFAVVNLCRLLKISPEEALLKTNHKFSRRFRYIEEKLKAQGQRPEDLDLQLLDEIWDEAKAKGL